MYSSAGLFCLHTWSVGLSMLFTSYWLFLATLLHLQLDSAALRLQNSRKFVGNSFVSSPLLLQLLLQLIIFVDECWVLCFSIGIICKWREHRVKPSNFYLSSLLSFLIVSSSIFIFSIITVTLYSKVLLANSSSSHFFGIFYSNLFSTSSC